MRIATDHQRPAWWLKLRQRHVDLRRVIGRAGKQQWVDTSCAAAGVDPEQKAICGAPQWLRLYWAWLSWAKRNAGYHNEFPLYIHCTLMRTPYITHTMYAC